MAWREPGWTVYVVVRPDRPRPRLEPQLPISPEALLLSALVRTQDHQVLAKDGIGPEFFHKFADEAEWTFRYILANRRAPARLDLKQEFPDFVIYKGADNVQHYIEEVRKAHKKFMVIDAANQAVDLVDQDDPDAALALMQRTLTEVSAQSSGVSSSMDVMEDWQGVYDDVKHRVVTAKVNGLAGVPTGFQTLDDVTGGLQPGWLTIIAARLGNGKTWTGVKIGFTAAMAGKRVIYFSLEQPKNQIAMRVHAFGSKKYAASPFNPMDLARGKGFSILEYKNFLIEMAKHHGSGQFRINDTSRGRLTVAGIANVIESERPDIVIIDYLTLLAGGGDDWRGAASLVADVQSLGHTYGIPVVALAQINRTGASGKEPPGTESLYQSDAIGHDADLVVTQMQKSDSVMQHKIAKFRHGPAGGKWYSQFQPSLGVFEEVSGDAAQALIEDDQLDEQD